MIREAHPLAGSIEKFVRRKVDGSFKLLGIRPVAGGSINQCFEISGDHGRYFVKTNGDRGPEFFEAEARGLEALAGSSGILVPAALATGEEDGHALLVLPALELRPLSAGGAAALGRGLARQHEHTVPEFGFDHDNFIGLSQQLNTKSPDWLVFFERCRLRPQLNWARQNGCSPRLVDLVERLIDDALADCFRDYSPVASLLHGDLWSGNAAEAGGLPVIFDPACYYGDREADIAMTELFGRFDPAFYTAYAESLPLDPGYFLRRDLYNLYHVLNHFNLFGGGYMRQAEMLAANVLSATGHA